MARTYRDNTEARRIITPWHRDDRRVVPDGKHWRRGCPKGCDWCEGNHFHGTTKQIACITPEADGEYALSERIRHGRRRGVVRSGGC